MVEVIFFQKSFKSLSFAVGGQLPGVELGTEVGRPGDTRRR